jgi:hypothetical protein
MPEADQVTSKVLPELLNAKIGESLGLILSRHVEAYDEILENRPLALIPTHRMPRDHNTSTSDHGRAKKVSCKFLLT